MHLWPSMRLRDSFKHAYLEKLEWNIDRMNVKKKQQKNRSQSQSSATNQDKLLDGDANNDNQGDEDVVLDSTNHHASTLLRLCRELLMVLSCCYCCFCCGAFSLLVRKSREKGKDFGLMCRLLLIMFQAVEHRFRNIGITVIEIYSLGTY